MALSSCVNQNFMLTSTFVGASNFCWGGRRMLGVSWAVLRHRQLAAKRGVGKVNHMAGRLVGEKSS